MCQNYYKEGMKNNGKKKKKNDLKIYFLVEDSFSFGLAFIYFCSSENGILFRSSIGLKKKKKKKVLARKQKWLRSNMPFFMLPLSSSSSLFSIHTSFSQQLFYSVQSLPGLPRLYSIPGPLMKFPQPHLSSGPRIKHPPKACMHSGGRSSPTSHVETALDWIFRPIFFLHYDK